MRLRWSQLVLRPDPEQHVDEDEEGDDNALDGLDLHLLHNLPGGLFELFLPLWLLGRGFDQTVLSTTPDLAHERVERALLPT